MQGTQCVAFLQWALPRMNMRWPGFRKVRRQVCKRIAKRLKELSIGDVSAYREYLERRPEEWGVLDSLCSIPISRFYRDRDVFDYLRAAVLPVLAEAAVGRGEQQFRAWSCGCASGDEVYTLKVIWQLCIAPRFPELPLHIIATDIDANLLARCVQGCYAGGSLKDFPHEWLEIAFCKRDSLFCIRDEFRGGIEFLRQDVREELPTGRFHLILCRHVVFTYFDERLQTEILERMIDRLLPGGVLVTGKQEPLPHAHPRLVPLRPRMSVYQNTIAGAGSAAGVPRRNDKPDRADLPTDEDPQSENGR
jgi:chemotaxis protein methyltransferase CheR